MDWDDDEFRRRITARAQAIGKTVRQVLSEASIAHDTLDKVPTSGRRIDTLYRLARVLGWTFADVVGIEVSRVTKELFRLAHKTAQKALRYVPHDDDLEYEVAAHVYNVLADHWRDGVRDLAELEKIAVTLAAYIAEQWRTGR